MESSSRIAQMYGYAVCLIAVVTFLISANRMIDSVFDMTEPLRANQYDGRGVSLVSFEAYKRDRIEQRGSRERPAPTMAPNAAAPASTPAYTDAELRRMFAEERAEHIGNVRFHAMRSLVSSLLMILIASVLFLAHWRWLRRQTDAA